MIFNICPGWADVGFWLPTNLVGGRFFIPDKLSGSWFWKFCPTWAELFFWIFSWNASKNAFLVGYHWEGFFLRALPKTPIPSATTWRIVLKIAAEARIKTNFRWLPFEYDYGQTAFLICYHLKRNFLHRVRIWKFFLEVYEESFCKPVDKSLLNVLTSRGIFFWSRWFWLFESPNTVRDIQKLDG